jgi:hypothetical protein
VVRYDVRDRSLEIWQIDYYVAYFNLSPQLSPRVVQQPALTPTPQPKQEKNDCMVIATENLHRLASKSPWSNILMFKICEDGEMLQSGHAVAVWKITPNGNVFAVDDSGTFELDTTSTDARDILVALAAKYSVAAHKNVVLDGHFAVVEAQ